MVLVYELLEELPERLVIHDGADEPTSAAIRRRWADMAEEPPLYWIVESRALDLEVDIAFEITQARRQAGKPASRPAR